MQTKFTVVASHALTPEDFKNAGYSAKRAAQLASDPATNWKASNGGKLGLSKTVGFTEVVKPNGGSK